MAIGRAGNVARSGEARLDGLLSGQRWLGGAVSYADPARASDYGIRYFSDVDGDGRSAQRDGFARLSSAQHGAVRGVLDADGPLGRAHAGFTVEGFTRLRVSDGGASGDLNFGNSTDAESAYAYGPGTGMGGDVWFGRAGKKPVAGNYDHFAVLHETGHALGLKHPHEAGRFGKLPGAVDSVEFTVMSYRGHVGAPTTGYTFETAGAPQSFMMRDIAALQYLYGADFEVNSGATVYSWQPGQGTTFVNGAAGIAPGENRIFATLWDGGGRDTYDLSAYASDLRIDLRPGQASVFSAVQLADLGGGPNQGHARGNIYNALQYKGDARSLIEDAIGGRGDDLLRGNDAANRLAGGSGSDTLIGGQGADVLVGGRAADVFRFDDGDSRPGAADRLVRGDGMPAFQGAGRAGGDVIDLRAVDADSGRAGDQAFVFGGGQGRGHLWMAEQNGVSYLRGNVDGDRAAEFELVIYDRGIEAEAYRAGDFLL